jgi:hypothetical protein
MTDIRTSVARRTGRVLAITLSALVMLAGGAVWQLAFRAPSVALLPLPERLVSLTAPEGRRMLDESPASLDYQPLTRTFESQRRPAFCGVASSVAVLNALRPTVPRLTQASFFTDLPTELRVTFSGMTLEQLGELLRKHGVKVEIIFAADTSLDAFRVVARENLSHAGDYVLVNYQRTSLGQRGGGHISPLAAYSAGTDRFLILDVAAYSYPPTWVSAVDLWHAMNTIDSTSGRTRGFAVIRRS